jgi:hypothetical protein
MGASGIKPSNSSANLPATFNTRYTTQTPDSAEPRYGTATKDPVSWIKTVTCTATTTSDASKPPVTHISWLPNVAATYMSEIAAGYQGILDLGLNEHLATDDPKSTSTTNGAKTSTKAPKANTTTSEAIGMAVVDRPGGSIVFLNTSSPNYVLIDYANASVFIWTAPVNTSTIEDSSHIHRPVSKINAWLPYFEALGILTLVWKVGTFVYERVKKRRGDVDQPSRSP